MNIELSDLEYIEILYYIYYFTSHKQVWKPSIMLLLISDITLQFTSHFINLNKTNNNIVFDDHS